MKHLIAWTVAICLALGVSIASAQTMKPVTLDGSKTRDMDTVGGIPDVITYEWYVWQEVHDFENETPIVALTTEAKSTLFLPVGIHRFTLRACDRPKGDPDILCHTDDVTHRVTEVNRAPVANAGPDQVVQILRRGSVDVALDGSASQGDDLSYRWTLGDKIVGVTEKSVVPLKKGFHLFWLYTVNDAGDDSDYVIVDVRKKRGQG